MPTMTSTGAMSVSSSAGRPRSHQGATRHPHHHQQHQHQVRARHQRVHPRTDYHTEHDTDRASSPRIGQRSQSLSALQPGTTVIQPRMAQLETLEAKMASIEVSLSSATPRRKKCVGLTVSSPSAGPRTLNGTTAPHLDQLEGLRNALRDKENIIRSLRGQVTNPPAPTGLRSLINGLQGHKDRDLLTDQEKRHLEDRVQRLKLDTDNKRLAIKNLKLALDKLDITDNIDVRIQQAELEYQLGREELNLLTLLEDARAVQARLDENAAATVASKGRNKAGSVHSCVTELGGRAQLLAVEARWDANSPRFGAGPKDSGGLWVDWAVEDTGLKKGDRLIEVNGKLVVNRCATREDLLRLLSAAPDPAQLVVLRGCPPAGGEDIQQPQVNGGGGHMEVSALRSELGLVRDRAEEAQRAKDGLRADNLRLTHRISYLEEQVSELLETRRHRHHNNHHHHGHHEHQRKPQDQHVRVVTSTAVNNTQNITNINIGPADVQVFQKGPQVTALVAGTPRPARTPSNPCIAASDRYTTDEEQQQDSRRAVDIDEMRPSRRRTDVRSVKSLDLDSEPYNSSTSNHYAKPRKSLDYTSEPVANTTSTRKRPTPPKKPIRLSLHRAQSLQSVENGLSTPSTPISTTPSSEVPPSGRKRTHRGERSAVSGLRWPQQGLSSVAVHLHQRQTTRWC